MTDEIKRDHTYHAEASVLSGHLRLPLHQEIPPQAYARLAESGGYLTQNTGAYRLEGAISFASAYTQVAGNTDAKPGHGWNTLTTAVVEGLNVMDVVTADRVVGQISTDHPLVGYVPTVTFLGTRFENLRIAGHPVKLDLDLDVLGAKPGNDAPYTADPGFIGRVAAQYQRIRSHQDLPAEVAARYNQVPSSSANLESIECSLVNQTDGSHSGRSFGHVIDVPNFGKVYLATLRLHQSDFQQAVPKQTTLSLNMIELHMGCIANGTAMVAGLTTNGNTKP
jgi:hypothetical protein